MMHDQAPIRWPAPAKLNLFLHVNGRRPDGYHELQTLFIFLNHGDWLEFEPIPGSDQLTLSPAIPGVPDEQNLIIRAARLLQSRLASPQGAHIRLEKVLPMGGGIGGGSSDAATTLVALNHLWQAGLSEDELRLDEESGDEASEDESSGDDLSGDDLSGDEDGESSKDKE